MTNLLEGSAPEPQMLPPRPLTATISTPLPPLPPPTLNDPEPESSAPRPIMLAVLAAVALAAAVAMGLLWMSANNARDEAVAARDEAFLERDADLGSARAATDALTTTQADLATSQSEVGRLETELETAAAAAAVTSVQLEDAEDASVLATEVDALSVRNQELSDQIVALQTELSTAAAISIDTAIDAEIESETEAVEPVAEAVAEPDIVAAVPATFDIASAPNFGRYVGELLSSRSGSSRLGDADSTCYGTAIINDIGLDALGKGLHLSASSADNNAVVGAMQAAASSCGIDLSLIF